MIRKSGGNDNYGGTSPTLIATPTVTSSGTTVTATTSVFLPSHVGQAMRQNNGYVVYVITAYISATQVTVNNAPGWSSTVVNLGGAWAGINATNCNGNLIPSGSTIAIGAGVWYGPGASALILPGNTYNFVADTTGQYTTDAGEVILSGFGGGSKTTPTQTTYLIYISATSNCTFTGFTIIGGSGSPSCYYNAIGGITGTTFTDCVFNGLASGNPLVQLANTNTLLGISHTFDRCVFIGRPSTTSSVITISLANTTLGSADYNAGILFRNCLVQSFGATGAAIAVTSSGNTTYRGGGVNVVNSTIMGPDYGFWNQGTTLSTTVPNTVSNSLVISSLYGLYGGTTQPTDGGYNVIYSTSSATPGTGTIINTIEPRLEVGQSTKLTGITKPYMTPSSGSPLLGFGSTGTPPTVDFLSRPKPSGGGSGSNATGYLEIHDFAIQDTTTYPTGYTSSAKLVGPGDQYLFLPVDATATTISLQVYQGSGYTGTNYATATIVANPELGITAQTVTATSTKSAWQTLTFSSITPSKQGFITLQVTSYDTSGTGTLNFGAIL
jgi:hypothetical protein